MIREDDFDFARDQKEWEQQQANKGSKKKPAPGDLLYFPGPEDLSSVLEPTSDPEAELVEPTDVQTNDPSEDSQSFCPQELDAELESSTNMQESFSCSPQELDAEHTNLPSCEGAWDAPLIPYAHDLPFFSASNMEPNHPFQTGLDDLLTRRQTNHEDRARHAGLAYWRQTTDVRRGLVDAKTDTNSGLNAFCYPRSSHPELDGKMVRNRAPLDANNPGMGNEDDCFASFLTSSPNVRVLNNFKTRNSAR